MLTKNLEIPKSVYIKKTQFSGLVRIMMTSIMNIPLKVAFFGFISAFSYQLGKYHGRKFIIWLSWYLKYQGNHRRITDINAFSPIVEHLEIWLINFIIIIISVVFIIIIIFVIIIISNWHHAVLNISMHHRPVSVRTAVKMRTFYLSMQLYNI